MKKPPARALAILAALAAIAYPAPAGAQGASGDGARPADETRAIQGLYLSVSATETLAREETPFRWSPGSYDEWSLAASTYDSCSLSFRSRSVSATVIASAEASASAELSGSIKQAWVKATFGEGWALAFGRRELAWKDGGYWNPSDVVNYRLSWDETRGTEGDEAAGRDSIELFGLLPFMDFTLDLSAATAFPDDLDDLGELPLYLAVGTILYPVELRAKAALQPDRSPVLGAALKLSLSGIELYADLACLSDRPLAVELGADAGQGPWLRYCAGGAWTGDVSRSRVAKTLSARLEYLRQDDGLSPDQGSAFFAGLEGYRDSGDADAYSAAASAWDGRFFGLYRDYCLASLSLGEIANAHLSLSASGLVNLDDGSTAFRGSLGWSPRKLMTASLVASAYLGPAGSEALALPKAFSCSLTLSRSF